MTSLRGSPNYLWDMTHPLGQGATSMVYKGRNKSSGEEVAVKVFSQAGNLRPMAVQMREWNVMQRLKHRNIVALLAIEDEATSGSKILVMELTNHGSLYNMLEEPENAYGLPEGEFVRVLDHVTSGLKHMRDNGIVHRDIKPGNILRYKGDDGRFVYKLTDFGAAKELQDDEEPFMSLYGTEEYLHPDIYERAVLRNPGQHKFTSKVDLWSLGVTFFHVVTGQLPFKPFGGRKNKDKMHEITSCKDSGVIMGVQHVEGGQVQWGRELPSKCRVSSGLRLLVTPLLAGLLEVKPAKVWTFDILFSEVENIVKKTVVHVFCPQNWNSLKIYINKDSNLTGLQELIAQQTEIMSTNQILIFDGQLLKDIVQPMMPVSSYPKGITQTNPIFCFNSNFNDYSRFPVPSVSFPKFTTTFSQDDYPVAKMCCGTGYYVLKEVEFFAMKQELTRRSVHIYVHELYHECGHLVDYHVFLEKNCLSTRKWKENFLRTLHREVSLVKLLIKQAGGEMDHIVVNLENFITKNEEEMEVFSQQVHDVHDVVKTQLSQLETEQLQRKKLKNDWNDNIGCSSDDRCAGKVEVLSEQIIVVKSKFHDDRKKARLSYNEEQIHKYEKNRLSEMCIKVKSLFMDHCYTGAKDQYTQFQMWYREALQCRLKIQDIEKRLLHLADEQEGFIMKLNSLCLQYHQTMESYILTLREKISEREFIATRSGPQHMGDTHDQYKHQRQQLIHAVIEGLIENQKSVLDMKQDLASNTELLQRFSDLLQKETEPG